MADSRTLFDEPTDYQICVRGHLDEQLSHDVTGMKIVRADENGLKTTTLAGPLADQAALLGILLFLYHSGYTLLWVARQTARPQTAPYVGRSQRVPT
jgi:hypothetical protein